ncbi:MAG: hypothetical protein ACI8UO_004625 [Verrucomicrobiales bacterium]|jgi:hypothetical protein
MKVSKQESRLASKLGLLADSNLLCGFAGLLAS